MENSIYKLAFKQLIIFCLWVALARLSKGFILPVMTLLGMVWAVRRESGKALSMYAMLLMMTAINPNILPNVGIMYSLGLRFGPLMIGLTLAVIEGMGNRKQSLPLGMMLLYLVVAAFSSAGGWCPEVSYLKLINFLVFLLGIWMGTKGLQNRTQDVFILRGTLLALCAFLVVGSAALWPFPGISTLNALSHLRDIDDVTMKNKIIQEMIDSGGMTMFCGVMNQSQALSPVLSCAFAWTMCDLLFVESKVRWPHILLLVLGLPLLYITRSRTALVAILMTLIMVYFYLPRKMALDTRMKTWLGSILFLGGVALAVVAIASEVDSDAITRWVRKTEDVDTDNRSLVEAVTTSRQGLIEMCMDDFHQRPALGMGFQVSVFTPQLLEGHKGLILSSPIEKGVIPIMILGETGVIGMTVFILFLMSFYFGCVNRRLFICIAMMAVLLSLNMGEATFFSPGGIGGPEWMFCLVGGYALDLAAGSKWNRRDGYWGMAVR